MSQEENDHLARPSRHRVMTQLDARQLTFPRLRGDYSTVMIPPLPSGAGSEAGLRVGLSVFRAAWCSAQRLIEPRHGRCYNPAPNA